MSKQETSRRHLLAARLKSAIASAALVGTIGGWVAFGTQQLSTTSVVTPAVAQVSVSNDTTTADVQAAAGNTTITTAGGVRQHHIIDPRTGQPAQTDVLSATVVGPDGPSAEMAAKVALIRGSRAGLSWLDARPTLAGLLVLDDGRILRSRRMDAYLEQTTTAARVASLPDAAPSKEIRR
jgi:hypothetical protein